MSGRMERWPWTPRKLERLRCLHANGCTALEIAREFGCGTDKVARGLALLALSAPEARRFPWPGARSFQEVWILDLLEEKGPKTVRELARALGFTYEDSRTSWFAKQVRRLRKRGLVVSVGRKPKSEASGPDPERVAYALARRLTRRQPGPKPQDSGVISDYTPHGSE